jgi:hypothetical protein
MIARIRLVFATALTSAFLTVPAAWANPTPSTTPAPAGAAAPASTSAPGKPRVKNLIFDEGSELEGAVIGPDGETIRGRTDLIHSNLIRVRVDFLREIHKTAEDL